MSTFLYNDAIGAVFSFVATLLGWGALLSIIAAGFWVSFLYVARRVLELAAIAKRDLRKLLGKPKNAPEVPVVEQGRPQTRLVSVKP